MLLKLLKKLKIRPRTWVILNNIPINKKIIILTNILKIQKTNSSLGNFYINH